MQSSALRAAVVVVAVAYMICAANAGTLIPIPPVPGSTTTDIRAINDDNVITGDYTTPDGIEHGFVGTLDGDYTTFDFPNGNTSPTGINNDGYITGLANNSTDDCPVYGCEYLRSPDGKIKAITKDGAVLDGVAQGIISHTRFVGQYTFFDQNDQLFYYGYYGKGTKYRTGLTLPFNTTRTQPRGYNKKGTVTGFFLDLNHSSLRTGFVLKDDVATAVNYPDNNATYTLLESVNDKGMIAGAWQNNGDTAGQAFLFDFAKNEFLPISVPGATVSFAGGINNVGVVAVSGDFSVSYIYCLKKKSCPLSPRAIETLDRWIPARTRAAICRHSCMEPMRTPARDRKIDVSAIRGAAGRDPEFRRTGGDPRSIR